MSAAVLSTLVRSAVIAVACVLGAAWADPAPAQDSPPEVGTVWRLLDYIAVDYAGAVSKGAVSSASEYAEQTEFADSVARKVDGLPANEAKPRLQDDAHRLQSAIADRADPAHVADIAHAMAVALLAAYPVPLAPARAPTFARGAALYAQNCAACHGAAGDGHGSAAASLSTPPVAFTDEERARQRSVFALYQVISQGIEGTAMPSFAHLSPDDRWALAFHAGYFAYDDRSAGRGEQLWKSDPSLHDAVPNLQALVGSTPQALEQKVGRDRAVALVAYLRRHPDAVDGQRADGLSLARDRLAQSIGRYRTGERDRAGELALSAYLDGFEPVEPILRARNAALLAQVEERMGEYRAAIARGDDVASVARRAEVIGQLLDDAAADLAPDAAGGVSTFAGAAAILLREGVEALLIVVAMIAFLRKAGRAEALPYVHAGWVGALAAGAGTWAVATWLVAISGASRELVEGFGSVLAAIVLLWVGLWMHGKAQAQQWQHYIRDRLSTELPGRSAWLVAGLAFVVVYREVFETILFYAALWSQGRHGAMLAGAGAACAALAAIAWALLRYSARLSISRFFVFSSWLMAALTVILAGKGLAALQEAGVVGIDPLAAIPRVEVLGLFPTAQTILAQVLVLVVLLAGFRRNQIAAKC